MVGRKGFTLIELLVVISIIAMLMAILLPSLSRAKEQAMAVKCQAHLRSWGSAFSMYLGDNNGYFPEGWTGDGGGYAGGHEWPEWLNKYYSNMELLFCPVAKKPFGQVFTKAYSAWTKPDTMSPGGNEKPVGSYGLNEWVCNPKVDGSGTHFYKIYSWRTSNVKLAEQIPMLTDCCWAGGFPLQTDSPPVIQNDIWLNGNELRRYCVDRHNMYINSAFVDMSVRKVGLKELWVLRWNKEWKRGEPLPLWPKEAPWMVKMPEYPW